MFLFLASAITALRLWIDPTKLSARNLTALDVVNALRAQNAQIAAGKIGQPPTDNGQPFQITLDILGRLTTIEDFEKVIVKSTCATGRSFASRMLPACNFSPKSEDITNKFDMKATVGIALFLIADANALETSDRVKAKMMELKKAFPEGLEYEIGYDTTPFISESIKEVAKSLRDAIILVAIVVLVFLQSWRSALIPLAAVPVAIIGTFGAMAAVGFSLNHLTLFGLVLSVGIVVDDAIVVVEAVQHQIEKGYAPRIATLRAWRTSAARSSRSALSWGRFSCRAIPGRDCRPVLSTICAYHRHLRTDFLFQLADPQPGSVCPVAEAAPVRELQSSAESHV